MDLRQAEETAAAKAAEPAYLKWLAVQRTEVQSWFVGWHPFQAAAFESNEGATLAQTGDGVVSVSGKNPEQDDYRLIGRPGLKRISGLKLEVLPDAAFPQGGAARSESGVFVLTDIKVSVRAKGASQSRDVEVVSAVADYVPDTKKHAGYGDVKHTFDDDPRNGWANFDVEPTTAHTAVWAFAEPETIGAEEEVIVELRQRALLPHHTLGHFRLSLTDQAGPAPRSLAAAPLEQLASAKLATGEAIPKRLEALLKEQFLADFGPYRPVKENLTRAQAGLVEMHQASDKVEVMVLAEREKARETHILLRGQWDKPGELVEPGVPTALLPWTQGERKTRVELARWLTARQNPLTARVTVNNLWTLLFGTGLVRTPEDFGMQGEAPTHPELLDWLSVELMENGWNIRHVLRLIATSATYRQSSNVSEALQSRDPANRLLARGARFRMPAWMLRDSALQVSGLLNTAVGGPPVRPYQPSGVWEDITMGRFKYRATEGAEQYRRTVYAFWRRTSSPTFLFDSAQRRVCELKPARTNTPLQALTLMNDLTYLEAGRMLAEQSLQKAAKDPVMFIFEQVLSRKPQPEEWSVLNSKYTTALKWYEGHPDEAHKAVGHGQSKADLKLKPPQLAATTLISALVLNLDEAITRE